MDLICNNEIKMEARRAFFRSLKGDSEEKAQPTSNASTAVHFSLLSLREFKGEHMTGEGYKLKPIAPRKRPSYDNTRRRFFASPPVRTSHFI